MIRWLSRYVKQITIMGVGIELREIPAEEALAISSVQPKPASSEPAAAISEPAPIIERQDYIRVSGTSASTKRTPRELDLMAEGDEIQLHVHPPDGSQPRMWVKRKGLQEALDHWKQTGGSSGEISVPGRTARKEAPVVFVVDDSDEVEVQAGWWIWVSRHDLKSTLKEFGVPVPW